MSQRTEASGRDRSTLVTLRASRMKTLRTSVWITLVTLGVQFILGMATNLFGTFPATSVVLQALQSTSDPALMAHMSVAFVLLSLSILVACLAFRKPLLRRFAGWAVGGFLAVFWAFESGIGFVVSGFSNNLYSFSMALGFLAAFAIYFLMAHLSSPRFAELMDSEPLALTSKDDGTSADA